jgi:hypothetical protein
MGVRRLGCMYEQEVQKMLEEEDVGGVHIKKKLSIVKRNKKTSQCPSKVARSIPDEEQAVLSVIDLR